MHRLVVHCDLIVMCIDVCSFGFCMLLSLVVYKGIGAVIGRGSTSRVVFLSIVVLIVAAYGARTVVRNEGVLHLFIFSEIFRFHTIYFRLVL